MIGSFLELIAGDLLDHHTADPDGPVPALAWLDAAAHQISAVNWSR
ncbi:hypothetical protein AB0M43_37570 [Longispora sp. NPDC051575]